MCCFTKTAHPPYLDCPLSFQLLINLDAVNDNDLSDFLPLYGLKHSSTGDERPTQSVMSEENGCCVNLVY